MSKPTQNTRTVHARSSDDPVLLELRGLRTELITADRRTPIIDGIDLDIRRGEIVALVGESGCGKSMTALSITRLLPPAVHITGGSVLLDGTDLVALPQRQMTRVRGAKVAMLFQHPKAALDPTSRVGDQIGETMRFRRRLSRRAAARRSIELLGDVGIPEAKHRAGGYPHQLSGGMAQRVMIASALSGEPELLIADEPTTALDVTVQSQILKLLLDTRSRTGLAILLITHDMGIVANVADRVAVMYAGRIIEDRPVRDLFSAPAHPYTESLLRSSLLLSSDDGDLVVPTGEMPRPGRRVRGCQYHPRCPLAVQLGITERCSSEEPRMLEVSPHGSARCWAVEGARREHA